MATDNRFRTSSSNVWERVSVRKNKRFQSLGTQHCRRVIKAYYESCDQFVAKGVLSVFPDTSDVEVREESKRTL